VSDEKHEPEHEDDHGGNGEGVSLWEAIEQIRRRDDRLDPALYAFVMESLDRTIQRIGERRHIVARELLDGFCQHARDRFGLLASEVIAKWGVRDARDVGRAVFQLVDARVLSKTDNDRVEDFDLDYDLTQALQEEYFD